MEELDIKESLLDKIYFNSMTLQNLNIVYDFRDKNYTYEYIQDSISNII